MENFICKKCGGDLRSFIKFDNGRMRIIYTCGNCKISSANIENIGEINISQMSEKEKNEFLKSDEVIKFLLNSLKENKEKCLIIPREYLSLKDIKIKNCRLSESIYNELVSFCSKNDLTITSVLNYIIDEFLKTTVKIYNLDNIGKN